VVDHLIFDIKGWQLIVVVLFVAAVVVIGRRKRPWTSAAKAGSIDPCVRHDWSRALPKTRSCPSENSVVPFRKLGRALAESKGSALLYNARAGTPVGTSLAAPERWLAQQRTVLSG